MAIHINTGFHVGSATPIDDRAYLTRSEMVSINESIYPDFFLAVCKDDGALYLYNKSAEPSVETGKFVALSTDFARPIQVVELPVASETEDGSVYQYVGLDETTYKRGYWYVCVQNADTQAYEWVRLDAQPDATITLEVPETATEGYLKSYVLKQFGEEVGIIDIPKDLVVTAGTVEQISYDADAATYSDGVGTYAEADVADETSDFYGYPVEAGTFIKLIIANQTLPVFVNVKDMIADELGDLSSEQVSNVEVGGINVGDVFAEGTTFTQFVERLINKYYAPDVTLTATPENKIVEKGQTVAVELSANVVRRSEDVTAVNFYNGDTVIKSVEGDVSSGGIYTHAVEAAITEDATFTVLVDDGKSTIDASVTYTFVDPYYTGTFGDTDVVELVAMNKHIETAGEKTYVFTSDNKAIVFAQPSAYAPLTTILDGNGFDNTDSFLVDETTIPGYRLYITKLPVTCTNFKYTFK